jgi:hypothetical protein
MFKPLTDSELFDLYAKEAMDKINAKKEMENNQRRITADRAIRQRNRSLIKGFGDELYQQRGGQKSYLDLVNNANEINFPDNKIHGFSVADRVASSRYSKVLERYRRRYGLMGRLSRAIRRPGAGRWAAGSIASTFAINSLSQASDAAQGSGGGMGALGSLANGALQGAGMGMAFGPQGALIGAGIGAVFSAATLLMDKGIRDSIGKFLSDLGSGFARTAESFGKGIVGLFRGLIEGTINTIRSIPGVNGISGLLSSLSKFQLPHFNEGKNFAGPALGLEARMSGRRPMVVNDGEFVIPSNGFATLSTLVSQNIRSSQPAQGTAPAQISFYLNLNYQALTSNPDEIVKALKQPVIQIIDQAWKESQSAKILRPKNA